MKKFLTVLIILIVSNCNLYSQNKIIKGRTITDQLETMSFVSIMISDSVEVGKTDLYGFFEITLPVAEEKICFKSVGLEPTVIKLLGACSAVDVIMMLNSSYDFKSSKKVDRLRKKRFNRLPKLHKQAFAKGIFQTDRACYSQEFKPLYKQSKSPKGEF